MSSFFKKPSWAKAESGGKAADFYRSSERVYSDILAAEPGDEVSDGNEDQDSDQERRGPKRRRISSSQSTKSGSAGERTRSESVGNGRGQSKRAEEASEPLTQKQHSPSPTRAIRSPSSNAHFTRGSNTPSKRTHAPSEAIELGSDDSGSEASIIATGSVTINEPNADISDDDLGSDDEFRELARKARERAKRRQAAQAGPPGENIGLPNTAQTSSTPRATSAASPSLKSPSPVKDSIVQILITSEIENTKSLIVHRKFSQDLRDVRKAWCHRQGFDDEMTASVFLTWKGKRLFDVTTCKNLGIEKESSFFYTGDDDSGQGDYMRVHMEAMTEEIFESRKRQKQVGPFDQATEEEEDEFASNAVPEIFIRITLKAPGIEDFKVKVRPTTLISNIIRSFREARKLPPDRSISLFFDGDRLEEDTQVQDNDIADMDAIDARVK